MPTSTSQVQPVGIDLGTTYSCLAYLTQQGQPETIPNSEGELSTPSAVLFDGDHVVVGTEALQRAVALPERSVLFAKRFIGDPHKCWVIDDHVYRPRDISALILQRLLRDAEDRIGPIRHAVITVPAQFSEVQRQETVDAGIQAGLERVDIINEPVAAALCHVLSEGMWFAELANDQTVLVFDLGGGTFDLSLVKYNKLEVRVKASGGDLHLGGLDWNKALETFVCDQFVSSAKIDPRLDRESMQSLALEVEQIKRALSVRPKASGVVQHGGVRKVFAIDRDQFEILTRKLVQRCEDITKGMLKANKLGWAHVDNVLITGGATRMPMIREMLKRISGTTPNSTLSPEQSICHGAAYYAGMILSGQKLERTTLNKEASARLAEFKQQSVNARALGILVKDVETGQRFPHYLVPANSPLPTQAQQQFGTVVEGQRRVQLHIVESGASEQDPYVELGACVVEGLSANLPAGSPIDVTIRYDDQARVHVDARDLSGGAHGKTLIVRKENVASVPIRQPEPKVDAQLLKPTSSPHSPARNSQPQRPAAPQAAQQGQASPKNSKGASPLGPLKPTAAPPALPASPKSRAATKPGDALPQPQPMVGPTPPVPKGKPAPQPGKATSAARNQKVGPPKVSTGYSLENAERPVPLCNQCGEPLDSRGVCPDCGPRKAAASAKPTKKGSAKRSPTASVGDSAENTEELRRVPDAKRKSRPKLKE